MNSHSLSEGFLGDYCDGELYTTSALFQEDPCALQIQLYYDELELCNPLGSKKHKLGKLDTSLDKLIMTSKIDYTIRSFLLYVG